MKKRPSRLSESLAPYLADESIGVTKLSISLPSDLVEEVRRTAKERRTSVSATIGAALRRALEEDRRTVEVAESAWPASAADSTDHAGFRGRSLGGLVDEALGEWLSTRGIRLSPVRDDEGRQRLEVFIERRRALAEERGWTAEEVESDVDAAVKEVREARTARRG